MEALVSSSIDAAYLGPNPAINAFTQSHGQAIRIISGSTSGGAALVVRPSIAGPADLRGKTLATPQLGNTQDVALRYWLSRNNLKTTKEGGGDVSIHPQDNAQTLQTFRQGQIDGAWVPEPWASRLVLDEKPVPTAMVGFTATSGLVTQPLGLAATSATPLVATLNWHCVGCASQ